MQKLQYMYGHWWGLGLWNRKRTVHRGKVRERSGVIIFKTVPASISIALHFDFSQKAKKIYKQFQIILFFLCHIFHEFYGVYIRIDKTS